MANELAPAHQAACEASACEGAVGCKVQHKQIRQQGWPMRQPISSCTNGSKDIGSYHQYISPFICTTTTCSNTNYYPTISKRNGGKCSRTGGDALLVSSNQQPRQHVEGSMCQFVDT